MVYNVYTIVLLIWYPYIVYKTTIFNPRIFEHFLYSGFDMYIILIALLPFYGRILWPTATITPATICICLLGHHTQEKN